jgi:hypothetical protein
MLPIAKRYLHDPIDSDPAEKMVFPSGPRQGQVHLGDKDALVDGVRILPLSVLCREVGIP